MATDQEQTMVLIIKKRGDMVSYEKVGDDLERDLLKFTFNEIEKKLYIAKIF